MKKRLVLALAASFVFGIAGTAFAAANPFVDVPAKHWAYDSVAKLAKAGVVDGYGDGTFRGDKTMSRYEMAQIVAKAMAKSEKADAETKALVDKLAVEFASELNNLGVRVAKLEKNQSSVKFSGDARVRWVDKDEDNGNTYTQQRFRLNMNADVNANTSFYGRFVVMDHNDFGSLDANKDQIADAAFTTKNPFGLDATTTVGRFSQKFLNLGYFMDTTGLVDGVKATVGNKVKVTAGYADFSPVYEYAGKAIDIEEAYFAEANYDTSKATNVKLAWIKEAGAAADYDIKGVGVVTKFAKDFAFTGDYMKNTDANDQDTAYVARLSYKGANKAVPQSWGTYAEYINFEQNASGTSTAATGAMVPMTDIKAWNIGANYALAKNITFDAMYQFNAKKASDSSDKKDYTRAQINFYF